MPKTGPAKTLTNAQYRHVLEVIENHRHPEKNALIVEISFKLGLRVQELSLLRIGEVATLSAQYTGGYELKDELRLPKRFTKGARAIKVAGNKKKPVRVSFSAEKFDDIVQNIVRMTRLGEDVDPSKYYPKPKPKGGKSRVLPLTDHRLLSALHRYLLFRIAKNPHLKVSDPLILSQKVSGWYSPNTLQNHIGKIYKQWAGITGASSHSGRKSLLTRVIREDNASGNSLKAAQEIAGHIDPSTTLIYNVVPEAEISERLEEAGSSYDLK